MEKVEEIVKIKRGRQVTIRLDVKEWRKLMKRFAKLKAPIVAELAQIPTEQAIAWLMTPVPELKNRTPKQMLHPRRIKVLYLWWKKNPIVTKSTV